MNNPRTIFHYVSYLQYPLMGASFIFYIPFTISLGSGEPDWNLLNYFIILVGVALSFSTLQDTTKTQNKISKRVWENPKKGKIALIIISTLAFLLLLTGLSVLFLSGKGEMENIAIGITVLGIGWIGLLKSAIEMYENHRLDKKTVQISNEEQGNQPLSKTD